MKICNLTVYHNELLKPMQLTYIQERYKILNSRLKKIIDTIPVCGYSFDYSEGSETCTIAISVNKPMVNEKYKISILNHDNLIGGSHHRELHLSKYRNFTELKYVVMAEIQKKLKEWNEPKEALL